MPKKQRIEKMKEEKYKVWKEKHETEQRGLLKESDQMLEDLKKAYMEYRDKFFEYYYHTSKYKLIGVDLRRYSDI